MPRPTFTRWLWLLTLGASLPLLAAEPSPDAAPTPQTEDTPASTDTTDTLSTAERDAALAEEIRAAEAAAATAPPPDSNESFVPSVQVSEDLSVSFPVDI